MLTTQERKEVVTIVKQYRRAHGKLANNFSSHRAHVNNEEALKRGDVYLYKLQNNIDYLNDDDIRCYALLVDTFEPMQRLKKLTKLQERVKFDVFAFVDSCQDSLNKSVFDAKRVNISGMSVSQLDKKIAAYKKACASINKGKYFRRNKYIADKCRAEAVSYARAILNQEVSISPENLNSTRMYLHNVCFPYSDIDVVARAINVLQTQIDSYSKQPENIIDNQEKVEKSAAKKRVNVFARIKSNIDEKINQRNIKKQEKEIAKQQQENNTPRVSFFNRLKTKIAEKREQHNQKNQDKQTVIAGAARTTKSQQQKIHPAILGRVAASVAAVFIMFGLGLTLKADSIERDNSTKPKTVKKEIKAPVAKQDISKQDVATVDSVVVAHRNALHNYYNSALDIIAGAKKSDVLNRINNQVKNNNIVLNDTITSERLAYAYFIYREYGFKPEILELAINGNQKLSASQQTELIKVVIDAGERGTGVQKMARERNASRGTQLNTSHSKFKNATKQQQRQHLVNLGVLKKANHR